MPLTSIKVKLGLPYIGGIEGDWKPDEEERNAAWEMYVELVTRISVVELGPEEGLLREALSSLYTLFGTTRTILREHGPTVAKPKSGSDFSFGFLAVAILNTLLRPLLAKWHPLLADYETRRPADVSILEHERRWDKHAELRAALAQVRTTLREYADLLAEVADVPQLIEYDAPAEDE
jgi:hypothetical protein